jgi:diguanylate cyclase (GGDEF)-like protein
LLLRVFLPRPELGTLQHASKSLADEPDLSEGTAAAKQKPKLSLATQRTVKLSAGTKSPTAVRHCPLSSRGLNVPQLVSPRSPVQQCTSMKHRSRQFTPRVFWISTIIAAAVLGSIVAVPQWLSKQARLEVLRSNVAQIARLAASVVDGDLHRQLLDSANYTPELYAQTLEPLVRFHSAASDVFYVYTMMERDGETLFVLDTAASDKLVTSRKLRASKYMEPFALIDQEPDPDWLERIARGETYVYPFFLHDSYGYFLSGHTPIYDSAGRYSGFVGVDFDIEYYLQREARFRAISIGSLTAALIIAVLIGYFVARYHYSLQHRIQQHYNLSIHDELTHLLNRRGAMQAIADATSLRASSYAAILVDVDDLKRINDTHGHAAGDDFLRKVADSMRASVREADICARLGGDEFLVFASGCDLDAATEIARRILKRVYACNAADPDAFGVSIGISVANGPLVDFDDMYRTADQALYSAKSGGKNRYAVAS